MDCLDERLNNRHDTGAYFFGNGSAIALNGGYSYCMVQYGGTSRKLDHTARNSEFYATNDGKSVIFKESDIMSIHLDLAEKDIGISKNNEEVVTVFENIYSIRG